MQPLVDKPVLLRWVSKTVADNCYSLEQLADGAVFLRLLRAVFPRVVHLSFTEWHEQPADYGEICANYDALDAAMASLALPLTPLRRGDLMAGRLQPAFELLALLYFVDRHARARSGYRAALALPVSDELAEFITGPEMQRVASKAGPEAQPAAEAPPIRSKVLAFGMRTTVEVNGAVGIVIGNGGDDAERVLVRFPEPLDDMLVRVENLKVVEPPEPLPPVGQTVIAVGLGGELKNLIGTVQGSHAAAAGERLIVEFPPPHGHMLVVPYAVERIEVRTMDGTVFCPLQEPDSDGIFASKPTLAPMLSREASVNTGYGESAFRDGLVQTPSPGGFYSARSASPEAGRGSPPFVGGTAAPFVPNGPFCDDPDLGISRGVRPLGRLPRLQPPQRAASAAAEGEGLAGAADGRALHHHHHHHQRQGTPAAAEGEGLAGAADGRALHHHHHHQRQGTPAAAGLAVSGVSRGIQNPQAPPAAAKAGCLPAVPDASSPTQLPPAQGGRLSAVASVPRGIHPQAPPAAAKAGCSPACVPDASYAMKPPPAQGGRLSVVPSVPRGNHPQAPPAARKATGCRAEASDPPIWADNGSFFTPKKQPPPPPPPAAAGRSDRSAAQPSSSAGAGTVQQSSPRAEPVRMQATPTRAAERSSSAGGRAESVVDVVLQVPNGEPSDLARFLDLSDLFDASQMPPPPPASPCARRGSVSDAHDSSWRISSTPLPLEARGREPTDAPGRRSAGNSVDSFGERAAHNATLPQAHRSASGSGDSCCEALPEVWLPGEEMSGGVGLVETLAAHGELLREQARAVKEQGFRLEREEAARKKTEAELTLQVAEQKAEIERQRREIHNWACLARDRPAAGSLEGSDIRVQAGLQTTKKTRHIRSPALPSALAPRSQTSALSAVTNRLCTCNEPSAPPAAFGAWTGNIFEDAERLRQHKKPKCCLHP
ncbi:hypothetical protein DIPPA_06920 [Diplonema papillatum]|nr:hypothetical protein DIPPA_06920 [Diplonema papillatum]